MGIELALDGGLCISPLRVCAELCVASFADSEDRNVSDSSYDPKIAFWHERSLAHRRGGRNVCGNQTAPAPEIRKVSKSGTNTLY
jgi:hypothetical protein